MSTHYDPGIIQDFADGLYARARQIIVVYTLIFGFFGVVFGGAVGGFVAGAPAAIVGAAIVGAMMAWAGYSFGQDRAFALRLQAQTALCQVQIEANTRREGDGVEAAA